MKLRGEFVIRQVIDEVLAIPVGDMALEFNGMIMLNDVSRVIFECLSKDTSAEEILSAVTEKFEVTADQAGADITEFIDKLREINIIED